MCMTDLPRTCERRGVASTVMQSNALNKAAVNAPDSRYPTVAMLSEQQITREMGASGSACALHGCRHSTAQAVQELTAPA
jgi:hypothetical protein